MRDKKDILIRGAGINLMAYLIVGLFLLLLGVPFTLVVMIVMVFCWGLFVVGYAFANQD